MGITCNIARSIANHFAAQICGYAVEGGLKDREKTLSLVSNHHCDVVTTEIEHVNVDALDVSIPSEHRCNLPFCLKPFLARTRLCSSHI